MSSKKCSQFKNKHSDFQYTHRGHRTEGVFNLPNTRGTEILLTQSLLNIYGFFYCAISIHVKPRAFFSVCPKKLNS